MIAWLKDLPPLVKMATSFLTGLFSGFLFLVGMVRGPIQQNVAVLEDHEHRLMSIEQESEVVVCWVRAQIRGTSAEDCLLPERNGEG